MEFSAGEGELGEGVGVQEAHDLVDGVVMDKLKKDIIYFLDGFLCLFFLLFVIVFLLDFSISLNVSVFKICEQFL